MPASLGFSPEEAASISAAEDALGQDPGPPPAGDLGEALRHVLNPLILVVGAVALLDLLVSLLARIGDARQATPMTPARTAQSLQFTDREAASIRAAEQRAGHREPQSVRPRRGRIWLPGFIPAAAMLILLFPAVKSSFEHKTRRMPEAAPSYDPSPEGRTLVAADEWEGPRPRENVIVIYDSTGDARRRVSWMTGDEFYPSRDTGEPCDARGGSTWREIVGIRFGVHQRRGFICVPNSRIVPDPDESAERIREEAQTPARSETGSDSSYVVSPPSGAEMPPDDVRQHDLGPSIAMKTAFDRGSQCPMGDSLANRAEEQLVAEPPHSGLPADGNDADRQVAPTRATRHVTPPKRHLVLRVLHGIGNGMTGVAEGAADVLVSDE